MALVGFTVAGYLWYKKESKLLWIPIAYFAIMETLQAITYFTLNGCPPQNQILTFLSYLHIAFQPFFINAIMLYFIPKTVSRKIFIFVFALAFLSSTLMLTSLYPFEWAGTCSEGEVLCGENLCAVSGDIHLAWQIPFNDLPGIVGWGYLFSVFILPFFYGAWKVSTYNILAGPALAQLITNNPNEWPTIWCLLSVAYIIIAIIPYFRNKLKVKKWYFWEYPCEKARKKKK
jgi:hypothetical protein